MRYLPLDAITPEMMLARPIFNTDGKVLLSSGMKLLPKYLERLREMGYEHLYVYEPGEEKVDFTAPISDKTLSEAMLSVKDSFAKAHLRQHLNLKQVTSVIDYLIDEILQNPAVLYNLMDLKNHDNYYFLHSINVAVISTMIARNLGLARDKVKELSMGALLHDLGMVCVDPAILLKDRPLQQKEKGEITEHPKFGFDLLRNEPGLSIFVAHTAYQHHERLDGSGYPRGLSGDEIHLYGRIVAVADSFEAMTSHRAYRKPYWSHEALAELKKEAGVKYDPEVVQAMVDSAAVYPIGSVVRLNTGEEAVVVDVTATKLTIQFSSGPRINGIYEMAADSELRIEERLS
ncbi:MAG: HD-GYP domain-containing protein [Firmicutes bacterium]|nr:HD-GYP domain-containing protein [Bacillota bacterium]